MSAAEMEKHREHFKQKHLHGEENKRKDDLNDELNFSYRLFRTHFEKVQSKKDDYERFAGDNEEYFVPKNEKSRELYKEYMFVLVPAVIGLGLMLYIRIKREDKTR